MRFVHILSTGDLEVDGVSLLLCYDCEEGMYRLEWNDGVANRYTEQYTELSTALARLACLAKCGEEEWGIGFEQDESDFVAVADEFFEKATA